LLKQVCAPLHCEIRLPARIDQISIEANELQSLDADRNLFQLNVQLLNTSSAPMAWPHLELQLNDSKDKPVILKSFAPKDYLPEGTDAVKGIAGHGDQQVKIYFELSTSKASGYHVAAFTLISPLFHAGFQPACPESQTGRGFPAGSPQALQHAGFRASALLRLF
jgi:hypothetical protein